MIGPKLRLFLVAAAISQSAHLHAKSPEIPQRAHRDIDFVPEGWKLYDKAEGDLNGDGIVDSVLVIQETDPAKVIDNPGGFGVDRYDANRRILLFVMSRARGGLQDSGGLHLVGRDDQVIPPRDNPAMDDPYTDIEIVDGKATLQLNLWYSAGSWYTSSYRFHFRWDSEAMQVIGYDGYVTHRASGEFEQVSINYLTMKRKDVKGNRVDEEHGKESWSSVKPADKLTLGAIGNGFEAVGFE